MALGALVAESGPQRIATAKRPPRARTRVSGVVVLALLAAVLGYVVGNEVQVNTQFDRAHASLDLTRHQTGVALGTLTAVRRNLVVVNQQVTGATAALAKDATQLKGVEAALAQAQSNVSHQGATITDLQTCLGGVEQSLNALSVGDLDSAIAQLSAASTACQTVEASSG